MTATDTAPPPGDALVVDCPPLFSGSPLDHPSALRLASLLKVLAEPGRLRILSLIQSQPAREACVCHLTAALGLSQGTVSHHLRVLFEAGLVDRERRGNWVYYRGVPGALSDLRSALGEDDRPRTANVALPVLSSGCASGCECG